MTVRDGGRRRAVTGLALLLLLAGGLGFLASHFAGRGSLEAAPAGQEPFWKDPLHPPSSCPAAEPVPAPEPAPPAVPEPARPTSSPDDLPADLRDDILAQIGRADIVAVATFREPDPDSVAGPTPIGMGGSSGYGSFSIGYDSSRVMAFDRILDGSLREGERDGCSLVIVSGSRRTEGGRSARRVGEPEPVDVGERVVHSFARKVWPERGVPYVVLLRRERDAIHAASPEGVSWFPVGSPAHRLIEREVAARQARARTDPPADLASTVPDDRRRDLSEQVAQADLVAVVRLFPFGGAHVSRSSRPEGVAYGILDWTGFRAGYAIAVVRVLRGDLAETERDARVPLWICDSVSRQFEGEELSRWTRSAWPEADGSPVLMLLRRQEEPDGTVFLPASQRGVSWFPLGSPEHAWIAARLR